MKAIYIGDEFPDYQNLECDIENCPIDDGLYKIIFDDSFEADMIFMEELKF